MSGVVPVTRRILSRWHGDLTKPTTNKLTFVIRQYCILEGHLIVWMIIHWHRSLNRFCQLLALTIPWRPIAVSMKLFNKARNKLSNKCNWQRVVLSITDHQHTIQLLPSTKLTNCSHFGRWQLLSTYWWRCYHGIRNLGFQPLPVTFCYLICAWSKDFFGPTSRLRVLYD